MDANNTPTKPVMTFTDEELENLKGFCSQHNYFGEPFPITQLRVEAIVGRLEAAEKALKLAGICHRCQGCYCQELNNWRIACGA